MSKADQSVSEWDWDLNLSNSIDDNYYGLKPSVWPKVALVNPLSPWPHVTVSSMHERRCHICHTVYTDTSNSSDPKHSRLIGAEVSRTFRHRCLSVGFELNALIPKCHET